MTEVEKPERRLERLVLGHGTLSKAAATIATR